MRKLSLMVLLLFTIWLFADNSPLILIHGLNGRPSDMSSLEEAAYSPHEGFGGKLGE